MSVKKRAMHRIMFMAGLILAGEAIFALPFHLTRFFRPTVLEVFQLSNTELGAAQGVYGILAMLCYFPGGPLADRFPARKLLALSLWSTAAGGFYLATFPGYAGATVLWAFFGATTILFFWAALIRATRDWGGVDEQGRAYGIMEGGRGLLAAALASIAVLIFALFFPDGYAMASFEEKKQALRVVIYGYTAATIAAGIFVWFVIADGHASGKSELGDWKPGTENVWQHIIRVFRMPAVWLQALIIVCAYVGYKGGDNYALYAVQGHGVDEVDAARLVAAGAWMRPIAAVAAGFLGDRFMVSRMLVLTFGLLLGSHLFFAMATPAQGLGWVLVGNTLISFVAIFGLRSLYFALFQEAKVPAAVTGTAVGLVSVIGFTPDIFVGYLGGILLDRSPGIAGHQDFFLMLAGFSALGVLVSIILMRRLHRQG
jgi:nitrate/nitrite transporter NarK